MSLLKPKTKKGTAGKAGKAAKDLITDNAPLLVTERGAAPVDEVALLDYCTERMQ